MERLCLREESRNFRGGPVVSGEGLAEGITTGIQRAVEEYAEKPRNEQKQTDNTDVVMREALQEIAGGNYDCLR